MSNEKLDGLVGAFVAACLGVFGPERTDGIVIHGSAVKGGAIPGFSDVDFQVYLCPDCFDGAGNLPDDLLFAIQERIGSLPWVEAGCGYPQAYFYDARRMPEWWTGPAPGTYRVLHGRLPEGIEATAEKMRAASIRFFRDLPGRIQSNVSNFADSIDSQLARRVRNLGTDVTPALFCLLTLEAADPLELWALPKQVALKRVERRYAGAEGPTLARQFYENVTKLYGGEFDPGLGRETFRLGVRFLRWAEGVGQSLPEADQR